MVGNSFFAAVILAIPLAIAAQSAPSAADPLSSILARLQSNIEDFNQTVPSFSCKEHVVSKMEPGPTGTDPLRTVTDSVFRVRRSTDAKDPDEDENDSLRDNQLQESRVVTMVNGKSQSEYKMLMDVPFSVFGLFSGGLTQVSTEGAACFAYHLRPASKGRDADKIEIDFNSLPHKSHATGCPYTISASGRALVDPTSMHIVHLENTTIDEQGTWNWIIDYAPIVLAGKTFWLPTTINSTNVTEMYTDTPRFLRGPLKSTTLYTLTARYTDYHLRTVTSKILIAPDPNEPAPATQPKPAPSPTSTP